MVWRCVREWSSSVQGPRGVLVNKVFKFLVSDQLDARFMSMYLFQFSTCFKQPRAHHQENQLYQYNIWYVSLCVGDRLVCRSESSFPTCTPNGHRHSDTYQMLYWYNWFSWWWARGCLKHVENWNKYIEKNCASSWSFTTNHNKMHGQQNIKSSDFGFHNLLTGQGSNRSVLHAFSWLVGLLLG